jgi:hypothetical protein
MQSERLPVFGGLVAINSRIAARIAVSETVSPLSRIAPKP